MEPKNCSHHLALVGMLLTSLVRAPDVMGQQSAIRDTSDATIIAYTNAVPANTLQGAIIDRSSGQPLRGGTIYFDGTKVGTLSDSLGSFILEAPAAGKYEVVAVHIGYLDERFQVELGGALGVAARIGMTVSDIQLCDLSVGPAIPVGTVRVVVRDVLTGTGPEVPVELQIRSERGQALGSGSVRRHDGSVFVAGGQGSGPFDVVVTATGYQAWGRDGVVIESDHCGITSAPLQAWLLPEGEVDPSKS